MSNAAQAAVRVSLSTGHALTVRLCAGFSLALGATTLIGWAFGFPQIVQIRSDWTPMVVNTAIGFVLAGAGLLVAVMVGRSSRPITAVIGLLIALLAVEEWCVLIFDLSPALSLPELHRHLQPDYPHPGRMAPNTALCFFLLGTGLMALALSHATSIGTWVQRAGIGVLAIGSLGVIGYSLQLEYLYGWTGVVRMAVHTGVGMIVLGIGLWNVVRARAGAVPVTDGTEVAAVYSAATFLLVLVAACAGIGGFAFLQNQVELQARDDLVHMTRANIVLFGQVIEHRSVRVAVASNDNELADRLRALSQAPNNAAALSALRVWAVSLRAYGISSVGADVGSQHWQLDGLPTQPAMEVTLHGKFPGWLLWRNGYVLRRTLPVRDAAGFVGTLTTEQRLDVLTEMTSATDGLGDSGETAVCSGDATELHCFPLRTRVQPFNIDRIIAGQPLPMDFALRGRSGSTTALDYRQHRVLAAYGPIGDTGLGLVVKRDIADIYTPIRQQFQRIVIFLFGLLLLGMWVLRRRLRPLLHALEDSRTLARTSSARFEAAVESNLDAFFILEPMRDAAGDIQDMRYVLLNARAERTLGRSRAEVIGHGMCELFPERRSDGMLARYILAIQTGEPVVEERSAVASTGQTRWYHLQAVKLGDGLGVTVRDITRARQASEQAHHQALHDPLTGLANRAGFALSLAAAIADAKKGGDVVAVALLDLDEFKPINDSLGHAAGDQVLQHVAARLRDSVRQGDSIARLGGDEFALVLPKLDYPAGAEVVARKVIAQIAKPMRVEGRDLAVTASIGISVYTKDGSDAASLLRAADAAMYRAKRAGRNGYAIYRTDPGHLDPGAS